MTKNVSVDTKSTPENEKYEKAMCKECKKMEGKEYEEQTTQYMPENKEEIHISHAMCTYTVSFYAIGEQAIFEYRDDDGIQSYEVDRKDFMHWLTDEEEKKVLNFEHEMREKLKRMESKERERGRKVRAHNQSRAYRRNACA